MSYKKLGDYIQVTDDRNRELLDLPLLGVSVQKIFIPSIANTIGTDMSKYKILSRNQFTYIPDTSRRGDKIGVALLKGYSKALVSQAYTTFRVSDINKLLPEYLMMWFSRPEFDRYARYHSIGSVREVFDWEDMCDVELPVPSIEKQREIVAQYQAVENKIKVNEQICEKLEATAQTLYKQWFVDFEFPHSPPLEGCPQDGVVHSTLPKDEAPKPRNSQNYFSLPYNPALKERAKELRKAGNLAEVLFWKQVRNKQFKGLDFDRQKIIGNYIVDFYNANFQLVIEIDGSSHDNKQEYDAVRQQFLENLGLKVVRYTDMDVKKNIVSVMQHLSDEIDEMAKTTFKESEMRYTALNQKENDHPAFQAPLQRRGMLGYKSSGGAMVYNQELEKEIPEGWEVKSLGEVVICNSDNLKSNSELKFINYLDTSSLTDNKIEEYQFLQLDIDEIPSRAKRIVKENDVVFSMVRPNLRHFGLLKNIPENLIVSTGFCVLRSNNNLLSNEYIYLAIIQEDVLQYLQGKAEMSVSTYPSITSDDLLNIKICIPNNSISSMKKFIEFYNSIEILNNQNQKLTQLQSLLLGRLTTLKENKNYLKT